MSASYDAVKRCRDFLDGSAGGAECDAAYAALEELEAIARWAEGARCYLESMACRYRRDGDWYGEQETASRLLLHPEIAKRCAYGSGDDGSQCRFHRIVGGECKTDMSMSHALHNIGGQSNVIGMHETQDERRERAERMFGDPSPRKSDP